MSVVKIRHLIEKRFVEIGDLEEKLEIATTMDHSNIKNKITFLKAEISSFEKNIDRQFRMPIRDKLNGKTISVY